MNKETKKKLLAPFPAGVVQDPPKGKFGKYVNHAVYVERLRDCDVKYDWKFEPIIINDKVIGGKGTITIEGMGSYDGAGDVESAALNRATLGECLKLAESDAFKRACMRFGLGVELWSGTDDFYADDNKQKPIEKTGRVKDIVIDKEDKALEKAKQNFAKDIEQPPAPKITTTALKDMVFVSCNEDKNFSKKCWKTSMDMTMLKAKVSDDVSSWNEATIKIFLDNVEQFVTNYADEYKDREGNTDTINNIIDVLDAKVSDNKEEDMGEVKEGPWMKDQPSEKQLKPFNDCVNKAIDNGDDELAAKAKKALADGSINKGNIFDWVDTDTWSLKDGS